jgi:hypothetical protein
MDSLITAAARALAAGASARRTEAGSPCATTRLRSRFEASRWRSSAMSIEQRGLLRRAARAFRPRETMARVVSSFVRRSTCRARVRIRRARCSASRERNTDPGA